MYYYVGVALNNLLALPPRIKDISWFMALIVSSAIAMASEIIRTRYEFNFPLYTPSSLTISKRPRIGTEIRWLVSSRNSYLAMAFPTDSPS